MSSTATPIAEQVTVLVAGMAAQAPAEVLGAFAAEQQQLDQAGVPAGVTTPGTPVPDAELLDIHGQPTTLNAARDGRPAVIVFYRGAWCPYCNLALRTYQEHLVGPLTDRGAALIAVSPQKPDGSLTMQQANELTFTVVSDPGNQIAARLGILTAPTDDAQHAQAAVGLDLTAVNADGTRTLPMPTTVIVDSAGIIRWIDVHPNYATRTEPAEILAAYDA
ncbi:MAG TPA: peroxiredoxin-like family protein [Streptosporangiaceae bacterium]|jgi:peroxiredoxin